MKYRVDLGQFRAAALWQFGGYAQNNGANGGYSFQVGGDIPNLAKGVLSLDAIYTHITDAVSIGLSGNPLGPAGNPLPPFLPHLADEGTLWAQRQPVCANSGRVGPDPR